MIIKKLFGTVIALLMAMPVAADDDVMITRDGSMMEVKIEKITTSQVTFIDQNHKKRGQLNAPTDFVYMILKEKGNNIFFDEEGNQTTSPVVKFGKKDNVMFLNSGKIFVIYNVSINKDDVVYQMKSSKKAPQFKSNKDEIFMIRNSDGTTTLFNNKYQERMQQNQPTATTTPVAAPAAIPSVTAAAAAPTVATTPTAPTAPAAAAPAGGQALLASNTAPADFHPAPDLSPAELETIINAKNPYTLYRKGSVAEYAFQFNGKPAKWMGGPTFMQQIVYDEKIENGLLVAYVSQAFFNKKHEPLKGVSASYKDFVFPTEIDTTGTYHLTHNLVQDFLMVSKRQGYGVLIPGNMIPGTNLSTSTLYDTAKNLFGGNIKVETAYSNWTVVGEETINVPAGTFNCVKLTGRLAQKQGSRGSFAGESITCWMARGVGIVQYESIADSNKKKEPFIVYLNKLELK